MFVTPETILAAKAASQLAGVVEARTRAHVRLDAAERPRLELLGEQLSHGQRAARLRRPLLEQRSTRLAAGLHSDFLDLIDANPFVRPASLRVRGTPLDMRRVDLDSYVIAGLTDHITPWQGCYRTARLYGSAHLRALEQRPHPEPAQSARQPQGLFGCDRAEAQVRRRGSKGDKHQGTWWPHWLEWIKARSGDVRERPRHSAMKRTRRSARRPGERDGK